MSNLFNREDAADLVVRMSHLKPDKQPLWGKMHAAQMLAHCKGPIQVALGEKQLKRTWFGVLFGWLAKQQLLADAPFKKNLPTDKAYLVSDNRDFIKELQELEHLIERFTNADQQAIANKPHPFFGKMTAEEWGILNWKHLDHHLQQFGV